MTSLTALLSKWPLIRQIRRRTDGTGLEAMSDKTRAMHARTDGSSVLRDILILKRALIFKQNMVHAPEVSLRTGCFCSLGGVLGVRVDLG